MTKVLVIDDHPIVLQGCRRVLQDLGVDTIIEAMGAVAGYRTYLRQRPTVVITDLTFEEDDLGGLALISRIAGKDPDTCIFVFTMHDDPAIASRALTSGATGYVLKDTPSSELTIAFGKLLSGDPYLSQDMAIKIAMLRAKGRHLTPHGLTEREAEILSLLGQGNSYDKIAVKLGISYKTVTNATSLMRMKLKLTSLADLIRFAIQNSARPERLSLGN